MQVASSLPSQNSSSSSSTGSYHPQPNGAGPPIHLPLAGAGPTAGPHHLKVSPPSSLRTSSSLSSSSPATTTSSSSPSSSSSTALHLSASTPSQIASFLGAHMAAAASSGTAVAPSSSTATTQQHGPGAPKACSQCETTNTPCWRRGPSGAILCNACGLKFSRRRNQTTAPGDAPLGGSVKPKVAEAGKPLPVAAGSVVVDGDKSFGSGGTLPRRTKSEDSQPAASRVNTAAALLEEIKKEREERLSSSGGSHPHALRGGSAADASSYAQSPVIGFSQVLQQRPTGSGAVRGNVPWPLDNGHRPTKSAAQNAASEGTIVGGLPTLELFSGLQFMKPRGSSGASGGASHNQRTEPRGKRRAGRDHNRGSGRSDEEEDSASSSSDDDDDDDDNQAVVLRQRNGSKRRQEDLELGLEQYAGESKRVRTSTRERKANLWTLDAHLHYLSIWLEYLNTYKNHIWTISPLDPAALDHNNARHLLCTNEGAEDRSALSLSVNFCLAIGALMHGDEKSHMEFYMRARQHLGYLFDTTDYSVALALIAMSHHTMYWEADAKRSEYYLTLAINIIAQLGAFHSDVYHRCLCMHSLTFRHGSSDLAKMVKLKQELRRAKQMPYYPITQSANSVVPYDMFRHLRFVTGATGIMTSVVAGINLFKAVSSSQGAVSPEQQIVFRKLIQALDDLDNEIRSLQGMDAPSPATALTMLAFITALRAECYMCLGDYKTGLRWANRFLQDSRKPHFRFVIAGVVLMLDMVMGILLRANQFAMLAAQMDAIETNCVSCPTLDLVKNKYKKHLIEDIQRRQIEDTRASDAGMLAMSQPQRPALVAPLLSKQEVFSPPSERESPSPASFLASSPSPAAAALPSSRSNQWNYAQLSSTPGFSPSPTIKSECDSAIYTPNAESNPTVEQVLAFASAQMGGHQGGGEGQSVDGADWLERDRYEAPSPPPLDDHEYFNGLLNDQDEGLLQQFLNS